MSKRYYARVSTQQGQQEIVKEETTGYIKDVTTTPVVVYPENTFDVVNISEMVRLATLGAKIEELTKQARSEGTDDTLVLRLNQGGWLTWEITSKKTGML